MSAESALWCQIADPGTPPALMIWATWFFALVVLGVRVALSAARASDKCPAPPARTALPTQHPAPHRGLVALPDVVLEDISQRLELLDAVALQCTCPALLRAIRIACHDRVKKQFDTVIRHFPSHVVRSLPMVVWLQVEWIDFDASWVGNTDYIDKVEPADLPGGPYKCCQDTYGRLALLLRRRDDVAVLFQRYTDQSSTWAFASKTLPIGGCRLSQSMVARLALWLAHDYADLRG